MAEWPTGQEQIFEVRHRNEQGFVIFSCRQWPKGKVRRSIGSTRFRDNPSMLYSRLVVARRLHRVRKLHCPFFVNIIDVEVLAHCSNCGVKARSFTDVFEIAIIGYFGSKDGVIGFSAGGGPVGDVAIPGYGFDVIHLLAERVREFEIFDPISRFRVV